VINDFFKRTISAPAVGNMVLRNMNLAVDINLMMSWYVSCYGRVMGSAPRAAVSNHWSVHGLRPIDATSSVGITRVN